MGDSCDEVDEDEADAVKSFVIKPAIRLLDSRDSETICCRKLGEMLEGTLDRSAVDDDDDAPPCLDESS